MPWEISMSIKSKILGLVVLASATAFAGPVSHFGKLVACGTNICGEKTGNNTPIQLKGPSLYWSTGIPSVMFHPLTVDWFVTNFNISVIRAPMAIKYYKENSEPISETDGNRGVSSYGYLSTDIAGATGAYKAGQKEIIKSIVDQAILDDIYVIVDWHSHNASRETSEAANFFKEMATEYKGVPNLIWEIYNEPVNDGAGTINSYATTVTKAIRDAGNDNLIIVGTTFYSSNPKDQESQGLHNKYSNIAYTLHFYAAANHNGYQSNKATSAPTFITEWGATDADGGVNNSNFSDASGWRSWMDQNKVSGCMWFAGSDSQKSAMFPSAATPQTLDNYKSSFTGTSTTAGVFNAFMSTNKWTSFVPSTHPQGKTISASVSEGASKTFSTELGIVGEISAVTTNSGTVSKTSNSITFQSAEYGSPETVYIQYTVTQGSFTTNELVIVKITDRKPILKDTTLSVSYKAPTAITLKMLGAVNTLSKAANSMSVTGASVSSGSVTFSNDSIYFTPAGQMGAVTLTYKAKNANGESQGTATLACENQTPTIYAKTKIGNKENTAPVYIDMTSVSAKDKDGDALTFRVAYLDPQYPGTVSFNNNKDTLIYTPDGQTTGDVVILVAVTDGVADSKVASETITLTGNGTPINVVAPTKIPEDIYTPPAAIKKQSVRVALGMQIQKGVMNLSLPVAGPVTVDVFDLHGHRIANVVNEMLAAGEHSINWNDSAIPAGAYIVRMRQGSAIKALRFVKR